MRMLQKIPTGDCQLKTGDCQLPTADWALKLRTFTFYFLLLELDTDSLPGPDEGYNILALLSA